jgi:nucleotide-binding universal stress UspA family protein
MNELNRILFATDFSETSKDAERLAKELQQRLGAELEIIHVFDPNSFEMPAPYYMMPGVDKWIDDHFAVMRDRGRDMLNELCPTMNNCKGHFVEGRPGKTIVDFAEEHGFDLIVMGTHGHTGWNRLMLGSIAEYVVRHAAVSVLTVKPKEAKSTAE